MSPADLIEQTKIYSEELQQWVVPLIFVDQALQLKTTQEIESNIDKLNESVGELNRLFKDLEPLV
jgi:hypothetical protein